MITLHDQKERKHSTFDSWKTAISAELKLSTTQTFDKLSTFLAHKSSTAFPNVSRGCHRSVTSVVYLLQNDRNFVTNRFSVLIFVLKW